MRSPEGWRGPSQRPAQSEPTPSSSVQESLSRLEQAVSQIHDSESFRAYLDVQSRFHHYSFGNALLILAQKPDATRVAGYRTWKSLGRQVRRGEKGIRILVPIRGSVKADKEQAEESSEEQSTAERTIVTFGTGSVFDIGQTEGSHYSRSGSRCSRGRTALASTIGSRPLPRPRP